MLSSLDLIACSYASSLSLVFLLCLTSSFFFFFFNDTATTEIYTLSLHDALPISRRATRRRIRELPAQRRTQRHEGLRREIGRAHVELQSLRHLVCRLLLEKKKKKKKQKQ